MFDLSNQVHVALPSKKQQAGVNIFGNLYHSGLKVDQTSWNAEAERASMKFAVRKVYSRLHSSYGLCAAEWLSKDIIMQIIDCKCRRCTHINRRLDYFFAKSSLYYTEACTYTEDVIEWGKRPILSSYPQSPSECPLFGRLQAVHDTMPKPSRWLFTECFSKKNFTSKP